MTKTNEKRTKELEEQLVELRQELVGSKGADRRAIRDKIERVTDKIEFYVTHPDAQTDKKEE